MNKKPRLLLICFLIILLITAGYFIAVYYNLINPGFNNNPPYLSFSANPVSGGRPLNVSFNIYANDKDGDISSFVIDFGDGLKEEFLSSFKTHSYNNIGYYKVEVTVIDNMGVSTKSNLYINVYNIKPNVSIYSDIIFGKAPLKVNFYSIAYDKDGDIYSYYWNFDDGSYSKEEEPEHIFQGDKNSYLVTLTVMDNDGDTTTSNSIKISILENSPPVANITSDLTTHTAPAYIKFSGSQSYDSDGYIVYYEFDFDDGKTIKLPKSDTVHIFDSPGVYNVTLTVIDNEGATGTAIITLIITEKK